MTTIQITNISSMLDLGGVYGEFGVHFDTDAIRDAYIERLQDAARRVVPSVTVHANGMVIADVDDFHAAAQIDWRELADDIDLAELFQAYDLG